MAAGRGTYYIIHHNSKVGAEAGLLARLRKQPHKFPLPSIYLTNTMVHKTDELELQLAANHYIHNCCVLIITTTWLHPQIHDAAVQLAGCTLLHWDRNKDSGKSRGGGFCIYMQNDWSNNSIIINTLFKLTDLLTWSSCQLNADLYWES